MCTDCPPWPVIVPVKVGVVTLVTLSIVEEPESLAPARSGVLGAFGDAAAVTPVAVAEVLAALVQEMVGEPPPRPEPITLKIAYA